LTAEDKHKRVIRERRKRERDQRIQSILGAAKKVFFSKGYVKATMDEIALEAEISKPTIYQYFKTKDDLFFSLMLPVIEDIGEQLEKVEKKLANGEYGSGGLVIQDLFNGFRHSYDMAPVTFRIVQLFQQTGLVGELDEETGSLLNEKGARNFRLARRVMEAAVKQGLIKDINIHEFVDVIWGLFVGIVQLEDIKSQHKQDNKYLKPTLNMAERIIIDAMSTEQRVEGGSNGGGT